MGTTTIGTIELIAKIDTANYKKGAADIDRANKQIEGSSKEADGAIKKTGSALRGMAVRGLKVATVGAFAFGTAITAMTIKGGISRALNIEDAQAKLKGLGHDAKSVTSIMDNALSAVKGTAYGLDEAATTAATAVAAGIKPGKELTAYLKLTADAATIAGISMSDMGRTMNKVTTVNAAYNDSLLEVSEKGIPIYQLLSKEMGVSAEEVKKLASEGKVSAAVFRKALEQNIGGAALESGKTTRGSLANMGAAFSRLGAKIVEDFVPKFRGGIQSISKFVDDNSANIVRGIGMAVDKIKQFGAGAIAVGQQVGAYLGPKLIALYNTVQNDLIPVLMQLWNGVIKPLIPVIGTALVIAIGAAVDIINAAVTAVGWWSQALKDNNPFIWAMTGAMVALTTAFAIGKAVSLAGAAISAFSNGAVAGAIAKVGALQALIAIPMVMPAIAVAAAIASLYAVYQAAQQTKRALDDVSNATRSAADSNAAAMSSLQNTIKNGTPEQQARARKAVGGLAGQGFSVGGFTGQGGTNEVAGIVHKGEYVLPKSMVDQTSGKPKDMGSSNVNVTINLSGVMTDSTAGLREVGKKLIRAVNDELKSKGQKPIAGGAL